MYILKKQVSDELKTIAQCTCLSYTHTQNICIKTDTKWYKSP